MNFGACAWALNLCTSTISSSPVNTFVVVNYTLNLKKMTKNCINYFFTNERPSHHLRNTYKGAYVIFTTDGLTRDQTRDPLVFKLNSLIVISRRGSDKLLLFGKNIFDGKHFFVPHTYASRSAPNFDGQDCRYFVVKLCENELKLSSWEPSYKPECVYSITKFYNLIIYKGGSRHKDGVWREF